jgi:DNA processing protein
LITANFGLEFGRRVFAVPGPITSSLSAASLRLIEKGAKLVVTPEDVIRKLGIKNYELRKNEKKFESLDANEKKIIELIENESMQFDEIVRKLNLESSKLATILSLMEIKGLIKNSGGSYSIIN